MNLDLRTGAVSFFVPGRPRTKGSLKPYHNRTGAGRCTIGMTEDGVYSKPWKFAMIRGIKAAQLVCEKYEGPMVVRALFFFAPEGFELDSSGWPIAIEYGDIDKLERNLLDALTQSKLIADDKLIVDVHSTKVFVDPARHERAGVDVMVTPL